MMENPSAHDDNNPGSIVRSRNCHRFHPYPFDSNGSTPLLRQPILLKA
ncbi:MAG: hypothetical protein WD490_03395 [Opitutales bacterium]